MIALVALLAAAALALLVLLAGARAQAQDLRSTLQAREAELRSEREARAAASAAQAALEARLESSEEKQQKLQETFAALSRQALDANTAHLVQLADQVVRRAQESSQAELDRRARAVEEIVRPVQESLGRVDEKIGKLEKANDVTAARLVEQVRALAAQEEKLRDAPLPSGDAGERPSSGARSSSPGCARTSTSTNSRWHSSPTACCGRTWRCGCPVRRRCSSTRKCRSRLI